jgi:hypothetical protein
MGGLCELTDDQLRESLFDLAATGKTRKLKHLIAAQDSNAPDPPHQ